MEFLHGPETNECTCPSESCLTVDSDGTRILGIEMLISHLKELIYNSVGRCGSVNEKQIIVSYVILKEILPVVLFFI